MFLCAYSVFYVYHFVWLSVSTINCDLQRKAGRFYPTRLALNIASGQSRSQLDMNREGYIVVETNYRVYAYTDSNLQVALLGLFCELMYRQVSFLVTHLFKVNNMNLQHSYKLSLLKNRVLWFCFIHMQTYWNLLKTKSSVAELFYYVTLNNLKFSALKIASYSRQYNTFVVAVIFFLLFSWFLVWFIFMLAVTMYINILNIIWIYHVVYLL